MTASSTTVLNLTVDMFVSPDEREAANGVVNEQFNQPPETDNFPVQLSADGTEPATRFGASGKFSYGQWDALRTALLDPAVAPGLRFYAYGIRDKKLLASNVPGLKVNKQLWSWAKSLTEEQLTQVVTIPVVEA